MKRTTLAIAALLALPGYAFAADVSGTVTTTADAKAAWAALGDFCGIEAWHPAVTACSMEDHGGTKRRTLTLGDGSTIVEDLVAWDDADMAYTYRIIESPLPVDNYESTIKVTSTADGARVDWTGTFDPKGMSEGDAVGVMQGVYDAGLTGIAEAAGQ
ncbi:hypothetical protein ATO13_02885 [Stappia sp. 22II-S9-Z10]|nr:hypothetical protein ATO13_02885 [Stappia sp. 22II-S9-Z10]